ncbi:MAG TPA: MBL fold metallo-hydrolase [Bauldia sp.]|nr:MBL fold metallo-hydrolase [Bauldia sp.]
MKTLPFVPGASPLTRRAFLAGVTGIAAAAILPRASAAAGAPHAFTHGDFEIIVISDGHVTPPAPLLASDAPPDELAAAFKAANFQPGTSQLPANITLLRRGDDLVMIDTGSGTGLGPTAGKLRENMIAAGIDPDSVTKVVFSHGHPDHLWGTIAGPDALQFPKATYYATAAEWDFWMNPDTVNLFPPDFQAIPTESKRQFEAVKDIVTMMKPGEEVIAGVSVLDTAGHTPGHVSFEIAGGDGLILVADAIVFPTISFEHPAWRFAMDSIQDLAAASRVRLLDQAASEKKRLVGYHWPYPGIGYAEKAGSAYRYVPET